MPFDTTDQILDDVLFRAGEQTDGTSDFRSKALDNINRVYFEIINGGSSFAPELREDWYWLYAESNLIIEKVINDGTVSVTENSASVNFSTVKAASVAGWHVRFGGSGFPVYKISAHTAGASAATLDSVYVGTTNANASYELFKIEYSLIAGIQSVVSPMRGHDRIEVGGMDPAALQRNYPLSQITQGTPRAFASLSNSTVRFSHMGSSSNLIRLDYGYRDDPTDLADSASSTPLIPRQFRHVLAEGALALLAINKNDSRAKAYADLTRNLMLAMVRDNRHHRQSRASPPPGSIITRPNQMNRDAVLRSESGAIIG